MVVRFEVLRGTRFRICAVGSKTDDKIQLPYFDFQQEALRLAPSEWPKLVRLLDYTVEHGPPRDEEKSRPLEGYDGLFEFKTPGGLRLFWFYDEDHLIICANGYLKKKKKTSKTKLKEAAQWQEIYQQAKRTRAIEHLKL